MKPVLAVDDERAIAELIAETLRYAGYECETDGYDLLRYIEPLGIPVIFITAKGSVTDRAKGLHMGADDYIVKPFEPIELIARVESVLRRCNRGGRPLALGGMTCDPALRRVTLEGREVALTRKEAELLALLLRNKGAVLSRDYLYDTLWEGGRGADERTLDTHIQRLRRKLGLYKNIRTVYGVGYVLEDDT